MKTFSMVVVVFTALIGAISVRITGGALTATFVIIGDHEYYIEPTERVNVTTAGVRCSDLGMRLVSLETPAKNSEIRTYLTSNGLAANLYWTEGLYLKSSTTWQWPSLQQDFSFYDWFQLEGQPDEDPDLNDVCLMVGGRSGWWDEPCDLPWRFICE